MSKIKNGGLNWYGKVKALTGLAVKGLSCSGCATFPQSMPPTSPISLAASFLYNKGSERKAHNARTNQGLKLPSFITVVY